MMIVIGAMLVMMISGDNGNNHDDKGDYPKYLLVLSCPNKQRSFEPFKCLDLVSER